MNEIPNRLIIKFFLYCFFLVGNHGPSILHLGPVWINLFEFIYYSTAISICETD